MLRAAVAAVMIAGCDSGPERQCSKSREETTIHPCGLIAPGADGTITCHPVPFAVTVCDTGAGDGGAP
jgi:hypothetical protein